MPHFQTQHIASKNQRESDELSEFVQTSANDTFKVLGPISEEEYQYYLNLPDQTP